MRQLEVMTEVKSTDFLDNDLACIQSHQLDSAWPLCTAWQSELEAVGRCISERSTTRDMTEHVDSCQATGFPVRSSWHEHGLASSPAVKIQAWWVLKSCLPGPASLRVCGACPALPCHDQLLRSIPMFLTLPPPCQIATNRARQRDAS